MLERGFHPLISNVLSSSPANVGSYKVLVCARLLPSPVSCNIQCCRKFNVQLLLTKGTNLYNIYPPTIEFYTSSCVYLFLLPSTRRLFCLIHKFMKSMFIKFRHSLFEYV